MIGTHRKGMILPYAYTHASDNMEIAALLIKPIQKIPQYQLLFGNLLEYTPEDHQDYKALREVVKRIGKVADVVDTTVGQREEMKKLEGVLLRLKGQVPENLLDSKRIFLKEGTALNPSNNRQPTALSYSYSLRHV